MKILEFNHLLQLQYDGFLKKLYSDFSGSGVYLLDTDELIAAGEPYSIRFHLIDGYNSREDYINPDDMEAMRISITEDTMRNEIMKHILMMLKLMLNVQPVADPHMLKVRTGKLNDQLKFYDTKALEGGNALFSYRGEGVDVETVIEVLDDDSRIEEITGGIDIDYAKRLMGLLRYDEALSLFLDLLSRTEPGSMFNTELNMYIGEICYHMDRLPESVSHYMECNTAYIEDIKDYNIRLGHSLIDDNAGLRGSLLKMYYRCNLNPTYKKSIKDKYERLKEQVEPVYAEHEAECEAAGANAR